MKYLFLLLILCSQYAYTGMCSMNWNHDNENSYTSLGVIAAVGFLIWVFISVAKDDPDTVKPLVFILLGIPLIGFILSLVFNGFGEMLKWIFSKDSIGIILTIAFLYLVYRIFCKIGDDLIKEKEEEDNRKK